MTPEGNALRQAMRLWASGVAVASSVHDGVRSAVTVSSLTSVSLVPPQLLVCLYHELAVCRAAQASGVFGVSILAAGQEAVSNQMAGLTPMPDGADRFYGLATHTAVSGAPLLSGAIAWFDCRLIGDHDGGTHRILVGEVVAAGRVEGQPAPLAYYDGGYRTLALEG